MGKIIKHVSDIKQVMDFIESNDTITIDIESTGLNTRKDKIIGFGLSNAEKGLYICHLNGQSPWQKWDVE